MATLIPNTRSRLLRAAALCIALLAAAAVQAAPRLAGIFGDGMVLQRGQPITVWGWAEPGEALTFEFRGTQARAVAAADGRFRARLPAAPAGGPHVLAVHGRGDQRLQDVWVGDVWLASGQSNMELSVAEAADAAREIASADFPQIRHVKVARRASLRPEDDIVAAPWQAARPDTVGRFSAVAYFFAREVHRATGVPIGIVNASWGGTHIETWTRAGAAAKDPDLAPIVRAMPRDLGEYRAVRRAQQTGIVALWQAAPWVEVSAAEAAAWAQPDFDDRAWRTLKVPLAWEEQGLAGFDGVVWYRRTVELSAEQAAGAAELHLGTIDDCDETWLNGQRLGGNCDWDQPRHYTLPPGLLKAGRNVIAVRVTDNGGDGGFYGDAKLPRLVTAAGTLALTGPWAARVQAPLERNEPMANDLPALAYNGMIHPLHGLRLRGMLWYQGESNVPRAARYAGALRTMVQDWRRQWGQGALPFYEVQLAAFLPLAKNTLAGSPWAELRDAQRQALDLPHSGMAVAIDIGDADDIHPRNKQDVGRRLARLALARDYGQPVHDQGPQPRRVVARGAAIEVAFVAPRGLQARGGEPLRGFAIAAAGGDFHPAQARMAGSRVLLSSPAVPRPVEVRYGWVDNPSEANLVDGEGLPAGPFRSDRRPWLTQGGRFTP